MIQLGDGSPEERELRDVFGRFPSGVTAVCGLVGGRPMGMTASTFVPVSLRPPLVSVCVQDTSATWPLLRDLPLLGISFLCSTHGQMARQLSSKTGDRFVGIDWDATEGGSVLIGGATTWLECEIEREVAAGDHLIVLFRVARLTSYPHLSPLVFHGSQFHTISC